MVVEGGDSQEFHALHLERSVPGHDVLVVPADDAGGAVVVVAVRHQDDVGGGVGRLDAYGLAVVRVYDHGPLRIRELEAGVPVHYDPHDSAIGEDDISVMGNRREVTTR